MSPLSNKRRKKQKFNSPGGKRAEVHYLDRDDDITVSAQDVWGDIASLVCGTGIYGISVGSGVHARTGQTIRAKKLKLKGRVVLRCGHSAAGDDPSGNIIPTQLRMVVFIDQDHNAAESIGAASNLLYETPSESTTTSIHGYRNLDYLHRFTILKDHTFEMNELPFMRPDLATATKPLYAVKHIPFNWTFDLKGLVLRYKEDSTTGTDADLLNNNIGIACIAEGGVSNRIIYSSRFTYDTN